ncbi:MAG: branched-chain amino acid ABC transporter permease [Pseudomonadota bacterium]
MELIAINLLDGAVTGLLLFMLSAGLTLIFSMMGVLNFAHASFYMLGAYFGYQISKILAYALGYDAGFFAALIVAPIVVGLMGAAVEKYGLRRVHKHGHVPELIFTFGLAFLIEEIVQFFWGVNLMAFELPPIMDFTLFSIGQNAFPAYKFFMIAITVVMFGGLLWVLKKTRVGLVIQAALSHPQTVEALGHNVPRVFMGVFGVGTALAGVAGVIAGPVLGTFPGMAFVLGSIVFVVIVVGGLGSLWGALVASMLIGWMTTFAKSYNVSGADVMGLIGLTQPDDLSDNPFRDIWTMTLPQIADILPYLFLVLVLIFRPYGLMGRRET